ncbi:MAG: polysaccharide deacetylase family protein [Candidatus Omnitrophica bacterium]|nr:polysaccharide deacetylase family protein [Candidatus Omnitrophota bacterium]
MSTQLIVTTSWDDGSTYDLQLAGLLDSYGIKGTFYIPRSYRDDQLKEGDIRELDKRFEIGCHTLDHVDLTAVPFEKAAGEIEGSKSYLESLLGHKVAMFSYPKGRYNRNIKDLVRRSGFVAARTCDYGGSGSFEDPYGWKVSVQTTNGSPRIALISCISAGIPVASVFDWETRAKHLFDRMLESGGVYHLWGHSWEIEKGNCWGKLERVLSHISGRQGVEYMTNGDIFMRAGEGTL